MCSASRKTSPSMFPLPLATGRGRANQSNNRFRRAPTEVFLADACGSRARGLEQELKASGRHRKKSRKPLAPEDGRPKEESRAIWRSLTHIINLSFILTASLSTRNFCSQGLMIPSILQILGRHQGGPPLKVGGAVNVG